MFEMNELKAGKKSTNDPFYGAINYRMDDKMAIFSLPNFDQALWNYYVDKDWVYLLVNNSIEPKQGWKIHITANVNDADRLLYKVAQFLLKRQISFKFIPNLQQLKIRNSKYADRAEAGKFITIYPKTTEMFSKLLPELKKITSPYREGPYILNDKQWQDSNVFFRYGGFVEMKINVDGKWVDAIYNDDGQLIPDKRVPYYYLPPFVTEPKEVKEHNTVPNPDDFKELRSYEIKEALHFSDGGGVYLANKSGKDIILKEGRPYAGLDAHDSDGFQRVKWEYQVLNELKDIKGIVRPLKYFQAWKHNYLVEEVASGITLSKYIVDNYPSVNVKLSIKEINEYANNAKVITNQLIECVKGLHSQGIAMGDLQTNNILFDLNEQKNYAD